ncbi:hypothetical protein LQW54_012526 [Pestalotiopsis sp. IQ-011]
MQLFRSLSLVTAASAIQLKDDSFAITIDDDTGAVVSIRNPNDDALNWIGSADDAPWLPPSARLGLGYADIGSASLHRGFWINASVGLADATQSTSVYSVGAPNVTVKRTLDSSSQSVSETYNMFQHGQFQSESPGLGAVTGHLHP